MKVVFYTKYSQTAGSSRVRSYQYRELINSIATSVSFFNLFDDTYLGNLYYKKNRLFLNIFSCYARRFIDLRHFIKADIIIIEKELFPYVPFFEQIFLFFFKKKKIFLDYDDAIFHNYDQSKSLFVRLLLRNKISSLAKLSNGVICGNEYLKTYFRDSTNNILYLPSSIKLSHYNPKEKDNTPLVIGWIGNEQTVKYLSQLFPVFRELSKSQSFIFHCIGACISESGFKYKNIIWSESTEVIELNKFDIGIMPLVDNPFERGKCGYKLVQYMALEIPVIASPVGVNKTILKSNVGYSASTHEEWLRGLQILLASSESRLAFGKSGRELVSSSYSVESNFIKLKNFLF